MSKLDFILMNNTSSICGDCGAHIYDNATECTMCATFEHSTAFLTEKITEPTGYEYTMCVKCEAHVYNLAHCPFCDEDYSIAIELINEITACPITQPEKSYNIPKPCNYKAFYDY